MRLVNSVGGCDPKTVTAARKADGDVAMLPYELMSLPRDGSGTDAVRVQAVVNVPGDQGEPVVTILLPAED